MLLAVTSEITVKDLQSVPVLNVTEYVLGKT